MQRNEENKDKKRLKTAGKQLVPPQLLLQTL
jgi:hypothetical protein